METCDRIGTLLEKYFRSLGSDVAVRFCQEGLHEQVLFKKWMSLVMVSGEDIRILIKLHFSESDIMAVNKKNIVISEGFSSEALLDSSKEITNQIGGLLKRSLEISGTSFGISLPLYGRTLDDLFFSSLANTRTMLFRAQIEGLSFFVQLNIDCLTQVGTEIFEKTQFDTALYQEIEFL